MSDKWKWYFPDRGGTIDDAYECEYYDQPFDEIEAAELACDFDFVWCNGDERIDQPFKVVVVNPHGKEFRFECVHEMTVRHRIMES